MTEISALVSSDASPPRRPIGWSGPRTWSTTLDESRSTAPDLPPSGLRAQIGATRDAAIRLAMAHIDLARTEAAAIGGEIARVAALAGLAVGVLFFAAILVVIGGSLFLAEWLLGSMGWGILHGLLLFIGVAVAAALAAVGVPGERIGRWLVVGALVGVIVAVVLGLHLPNRLYAAIGDALNLPIDPGTRPLAVGVGIGAILGLLAGIVVALRLDDGGARVGALVAAIILGALLGAVTAITFEAQVAAGIGIAVAYATWIALMAADVTRTGIDTDALRARFYPRRTIETSKETLEWLQRRMPPGFGS